VLFCLEDKLMSSIKKYSSSDEFEKDIKEYLKQGREKLENDLAGTR